MQTNPPDPDSAAIEALLRDGIASGTEPDEAAIDATLHDFGIALAGLISDVRAVPGYVAQSDQAGAMVKNDLATLLGMLMETRAAYDSGNRPKGLAYQMLTIKSMDGWPSQRLTALLCTFGSLLLSEMVHRYGSVAGLEKALADPNDPVFLPADK